jgi:hypothetical protein
VALGSADADAEIFYTLDGGMPSPSSTRYTTPVGVDRSLALKVVAVARGVASPVMTFGFRQLSDYPRLTLSAKYAPQYAAAGDDTLIDGLRGNDSFKTGRWQGFFGTDLDATVDLGESRDIRQIAMGFLQDTGSWIFMPRRIHVETSEDGAAFTGAGTVSATVADSESKATIGDYTLKLPAPRRARFVRVRVERYGKLPAWHPGAGNESWFFADEIVVR